MYNSDGGVADNREDRDSERGALPGLASARRRKANNRTSIVEDGAAVDEVGVV